MQNDPEKTVGNYNELQGEHVLFSRTKGVIDLDADAQSYEEWQDYIRTALGLVIDKINEILGPKNRLSNNLIEFPRICIVQSDPRVPNAAGYFSSMLNQITLVNDKIPNNSTDKVKVIIHELIHFLSHNGCDSGEMITEALPISMSNNVGFRRLKGIDVRDGNKGGSTGDYFLAFNEAVTEQLTIDILPDGYSAYSEYRELLNQVIDDAVSSNLGSNNKDGLFTPWLKDQIKSYVYVCFFRGDLVGFTDLLKLTYSTYDISEQQFGLMTHKDDLPSIVKRRLSLDNPGGPPPTPSKVRVAIQRRLNNKAPQDYVTDIIDSAPDDMHGMSYDSFMAEAKIIPSARVNIEGIDYDADNAGLIIYRGDDASVILQAVTEKLNDFLVRLDDGQVSKKYINNQIDKLLFDQYRMSMLSDGFRNFYIYKHTKLDG